MLERELDWDFPSGCSSFSLRGCPASALSVAGNGCRLIAEPCRLVRSSGRLTCSRSRLFSFPLTLPGVVMTFRVGLPRAPALWQVLEAMLAEGALESPSVLVLAFQWSVFLVEGSSDGLAAGGRFLSLGRLCLTHSVHDEVNRFFTVSV